MEAIEDSSREYRKELEQRSAETCAVSTTHLELFQTKAEQKQKEAAQDYENTFKAYSEFLKVNM